MYGLTEAFLSTLLDPALVADHPTSMGRAIPVADPPAARLEHEDLEAREPVEDAVVEQRRELVSHADGRDDRRQKPPLLHVLPRDHAIALGPPRLEGGVECARDAEDLRGRGERLVLGRTER